MTEKGSGVLMVDWMDMCIYSNYIPMVISNHYYQFQNPPN